MARRIATDAERTLWRAAMQGVRRYAAQPAPPPAPAPLAPDPASVSVVETAARRAPPQSAGVDGATEERLRRGRIAIDGRIDLHGMTQAEAFRALIGFVEDSARQGRRMLLVITGKGAVGQGGGVLRRSVPGWLAASPASRRILAVTAAHPRHGGDGALYVLLRRARR